LEKVLTERLDLEDTQSDVWAAPVVVGELPGHVDLGLVTERRSLAVPRGACTGSRAGEDDRILVTGLCKVGHRAKA
jgi:hypothetical protein